MRGLVGRDRRTGVGRVASLAVVLAIALAGCSSGGDVDSESASAGGSTAEEMPAERGTLDSADGGGTDSPPGRAGVQTRAVISTGVVQLEAADLSDVRTEIDRMMGRYGGFVAKEKTQSDAEGTTSSSTLELRVPSQHFETVMTSFDEFATVVDTGREAEDVTTEVIDVESRIRTQEVSLNRLRGFLDEARNVNEVIRLESEIARREADLASLRSQQEYLEDQTSLATITVRMALPAEEIEEEEDPLADAGFLTGLKNGWEALTDVAIVAATAFGALLPFLAVLALVLVPLVVWVRTRSKRRTGPPAPASPPSTP